MAKTTRTKEGWGVLLLNCAVAAYLIATGIIGLKIKGLSALDGGEISRGVATLFQSSDIAPILVIILSVLAIAAGVFVLTKVFGRNIPMPDLVFTVIAITWIVFIVMLDIIHPLSTNYRPLFFDWLLNFGAHLMVLAGILLTKGK